MQAYQYIVFTAYLLLFYGSLQSNHCIGFTGGLQQFRLNFRLATIYASLQAYHCLFLFQAYHSLGFTEIDFQRWTNIKLIFVIHFSPSLLGIFAGISASYCLCIGVNTEYFMLITTNIYPSYQVSH